MAKAKSQPPEETPPVETKAEAKAEAPKENLIPCTVASYFADGNMAGEFAQYGYSVEWPRGQKRYLPWRLIERVKNSGGEIELLRD